MKTDTKRGAVVVRKNAVGKSRGTRVRTRCSGRTPDEEVEAQMVEALPQIVRATVDKAKGGSLIHTKWLWATAERSLKQKGSAEAGKARESLASLLMAQLGE